MESCQSPSSQCSQETHPGSSSTAGFPSPCTNLTSPENSNNSGFPDQGITSPASSPVTNIETSTIDVRELSSLSSSTSQMTTVSNNGNGQSTNKRVIRRKRDLCLLCKKPALAGDHNLLLDNKRKRLVAFCKQMNFQHLLKKVQSCTSEMVPLCKNCYLNIRIGYEAQLEVEKQQAIITKANNDIIRGTIHIHDDMGENTNLLNELPEAIVNFRREQREENASRQAIAIPAGTSNTFTGGQPTVPNPDDSNSTVTSRSEVAETTSTDVDPDSNSGNGNSQQLGDTDPSVVVKQDVDSASGMELDNDDYEDTVVPLKKLKKRNLVKNYEIFCADKQPGKDSHPTFPECYKCPFCAFGIEKSKSRRGGEPPLKIMREHFDRVHPAAAPIPYIRPSGYKCPVCRQRIFGCDVAEFHLHQKRCKAADDKRKATSIANVQSPPEQNITSPAPQFSGATATL